jgi:putative NADPH-quinone reductase
MKVFVVYAHPSKDSLTRHVLNSFISDREAGWEAGLKRAYGAGLYIEIGGALLRRRFPNRS